MVDVAPKTLAEAARERRDIVSGAVMAEAKLIRFVASPEGVVTPDLARRLPGRGMWVAADRASVEQAAKKNAFARSAKTKLSAPAGLADLIEQLLERRCLDALGLARREGVLISGFEKASAAIKGGKAAWLVEASDGSADGRRKLFNVVSRASPAPEICGAFTGEQIGVATGGENVIHSVLLAGRTARRWTHEVHRLAGFRPLLPPSWRGDHPAEA